MLEIIRTCLKLLIIVVHFSVLGCHRETDSGTSKLVSSAQAEAAPKTGFHESEWVTSSDGVIAVRLSAAAAEFEKAKPIIVIAELRNDTAMPVNVLRPFGDEYRAYMRHTGRFLPRLSGGSRGSE